MFDSFRFATGKTRLLARQPRKPVNLSIQPLNFRSVLWKKGNKPSQNHIPFVVYAMQGKTATVHQLTHLCDPPDTVCRHLLLTRLSRTNRRLAHQPAKPQLYQYSIFRYLSGTVDLISRGSHCFIARDRSARRLRTGTRPTLA